MTSRLPSEEMVESGYGRRGRKSVLDSDQSMSLSCFPTTTIQIDFFQD